jgi:hypothetical protein
MSNSPEMICDTIRVERLLKASPARVFAALTDHEARRRWEPTPEGITAGPVARCSPILTGIASQTVNRRSNLTPYRLPILTPLSGSVWR